MKKINPITEVLHTLIGIAVITAFLIMIALFFDYTLNGYVADKLFDFLGKDTYNVVSHFRTIILCAFYISVVVCYCLVRIFRLSNASRAREKYVQSIAVEAEQRKNDLVLYLAHDLKTPLTSIIGYLDLLSRCPELTLEQRAKYIDITANKADRLEQLINEFFEITRYNLQSISLDNNHFDLSVMLLQLSDEFYPVFEEKHLSIQTDLPPHLEITADADKLARVFDNLLRNACIYSTEGTEIQLTCTESDGFAHISFSNHGDQIPADKLTRIFDKFFRADSSRGTKNGGAGLGLAIAKNIVELHQGSIEATSDEDLTTFTIHIPIVRKS